MERFGLVGLPNAGKSSLYNALTGGGALAAPYPFATKDPNIGVAKVPDERLDQLAAMSKSKQHRPRGRSQVVDIGGLVEGASKGEGLGNKFLGQHPRGRRDRVRAAGVRRRRRRPVPTIRIEHLRVVEIELALADLETVEKRLQPGAAPGQVGQDARRRDRGARDGVRRRSAKGRPLYRAGLKAESRDALAPYFLLTNRPVLAVVNVGEDELDPIPEVEDAGPRRDEQRRRQRRGDRHVRAAGGRGGARSRTRPNGPRCSRASASARARCSAWCAARTTCSGCARSSRPARRRPAHGRSTPAPRRRSAPAGSTPTSSAASSAPR